MNINYKQLQNQILIATKFLVKKIIFYVLNIKHF